MARRLQALLAGLLAFGLAAISGGCGLEKTYEPAVEKGFFGVNAQALRAMTGDGRTELLAIHLDAIRASGMGFVRANIDWPALEPAPPQGGEHTYDFSALDLWVAALAERDLDWQATLVGIPTPDWAVHPETLARCGYQSAPKRAADFVALMEAIAGRYGRGGAFWSEHPELDERPLKEYEIWNEANLGSFWCLAPDPVLYAELLLRSARVIHEVDPRAEVVMGGLAGFRESEATGDASARLSARDFLAALAVAEPDLIDEVDQVGVHTYPRTPEAFLDDLVWYRDALRDAGFGEVPMTVNEAGAYTSGVADLPPTPEEDRAAIIGEIAELVPRTDCNVSSFAPHTWVSEESDPANIDHWYGIVDPVSSEPYPTATTYLDRIATFRGRGDDPPPEDELKVCGEP